MNCLIVDDSATIRKLITEALTHIGTMQIDEAADGADAVEQCRGRRYDLILMDWNMPTMTGLDAVRAIRGLGSRSAIIMVTTEAEKSRVIEALNDGVDNYIIKPFQIPAFVEKIEAVLKKIPPARAPKAAQVDATPEQAQLEKMVEARYLDPIVEELQAVFDTLLGCSLKVTERGLADSGKRPDYVLALIGISGSIKGTLGLSFPPATAFAVVNRMTFSDNACMNEELFDGLAELANIIGGKSKAKLSEVAGETLELSLPLVIQGNYLIYSPANTLWTELRIESELGHFFLRVTTQAVSVLV